VCDLVDKSSDGGREITVCDLVDKSSDGGRGAGVSTMQPHHTPIETRDDLNQMATSDEGVVDIVDKDGVDVEREKFDQDDSKNSSDCLSTNDRHVVDSRSADNASQDDIRSRGCDIFDSTLDVTSSSSHIDEVPIITRSGRMVKKNIKPKTYVVKGLLAKSDNMSIKAALKGARPEEAKKAILSEIQNMIDFSVGFFIFWRDIPKNQRRNIIRAFMFIKEKYYPNGDHDKTKARIVADGSGQDTMSYDNISSSTIDLSSVFLLLNIGSFLRCVIVSYDIKGAFLHARFEEEDPTIYIKISKDIVQFWKLLDPTIENYEGMDGEVIMKLDKYIYGLKQSPRKFQEHLSETILSLGYVQSTYDKCLYIKKHFGNISILSTHVDDICQVSNCDEWIIEVKEKLIKVYKNIEVQHPIKSYLGMNITRISESRNILINQPKLTQEIIDMYLERPIIKATPSSISFLDDNNSMEQQQEIDKSKYLGLVMKLMYLARLTRPDILFSVTYLATKCQHPTNEEWKKCQRIIQYLNGTRTYGIHINCTNVDTYAHCDASYASHSDGRSHTGYIFSIGKNYSYVHASSIKQKIGSASSTDAEIIATKQCCKFIIWIKNIISELNISSIKPTIVFQDNMSSITINTSTKSSYKRVKHMMSSIAFIKNMISYQEIQLKYLQTENMTADMLTKSLGVTAFCKHRSSIGVKDISDEENDN
jgi:hypothetical protein